MTSRRWSTDPCRTAHHRRRRPAPGHGDVVPLKVAAATGDPTVALALGRLAAAHAERGGFTYLHGLAFVVQAGAKAALGDVRRARQPTGHALRVLVPTGYPAGI